MNVRAHDMPCMHSDAEQQGGRAGHSPRPLVWRMSVVNPGARWIFVSYEVGGCRDFGCYGSFCVGGRHGLFLRGGREVKSIIV